jgi:Escherichia/Staphylococcus phage prohead protease
MSQIVNELRSKYSTDEIAELGAKGQALKNGASDWSYPIKDEDDLRKAIRAVGRSGSDHDAIRRHGIKVAKKLGYSELIPDNWASNGSLEDKNSVWDTTEKRDTANNTFTALEGAVADQCSDEGYSSWSIWVQDWYGSGADDDPYTVVYTAGGDLWQRTFDYDEDNKVVLGDEPAKVRPITIYVEREKPKPLHEFRKQRAESLRASKTFERRSFAVSDFEIRESDEDGRLHFAGYASVTDRRYSVGGFTETIERGAFKRTLGEDPDVVFLVAHEGLPLARTKRSQGTAELPGKLVLSEDERGLKVDATFDPEDPDAKRLELKMRNGLIDQMSFAFRATDDAWNDDWTDRTVKAVSIHGGDVSTVVFGANTASTGSIRADDALMALGKIGGEGVIGAFAEWRDWTLLPDEERAEKKLSTDAMETLSQVMTLVAVDEEEPLLAELMNVGRSADSGAAREERSLDDLAIARARLEVGR